MSDTAPRSIQTPDTVETRLGTLNFRKGFLEIGVEDSEMEIVG